MASTFSPGQHTNMANHVANSSRQAVVDVLSSDIIPHLNNSRWLGIQNRYLYNTINRIKDDLNSSTAATLKKNQLKQYIAVSPLIHCKDGWDYLSASIASYISGNYSKVIHFAYYAELRAAMTILATEGIGVLDRKHFYLDNAGDVKNGLTLPTHQYSWFALQKWGNDSSKSGQILKSIEVNGRSIEEWINSTPLLTSPATTSLLASQWLDEWSIDISVFEDDRDIRNSVSYRPQNIKRSVIHKPNVIKEIELIKELWSSSEPTTLEPFYEIDHHLLRKAMCQAWTVINTAEPGIRDLDDVLNNIIANTGMTISTTTREFLTKRSKTKRNKVFKHAESNAMNNKGKLYPGSIMSRSFLLLRLSTALVRKLLSDAGVTHTNIQFWTDEIGVHHGLWDSASPPTSFDELWIDVEAAITDTDAWVIGAGTKTLYDFNEDLRPSVNSFTQTQRAYLWGLL